MKKIFGNLFLIGGLFAPCGAFAQSLGYFETTPYYNNTTIIVNQQSEPQKPPAPMPAIIEKTSVKSPYLITHNVEVTTPVKQNHVVTKPKISTKKTAKKADTKKISRIAASNNEDVPSRVILFCGTPAEPNSKPLIVSPSVKTQNTQVVEDWHPVDLTPQHKVQNEVNISTIAKSKNNDGGLIDDLINQTATYKQEWNEFNRRPQSREEFAVRGPVKAIYQDTKSAIANDVPQAIADYLPWVDTNRKQENFESVLDRVADNLQRANAADPEWAYSAQSEIRELAQKLDKLPSPPQYREETVYKNYDPKQEEISGSDEYHKRPVWAGASANNAEQPQKPIALKNNN